MTKSPRMECITASRIKVGFESGVGVNRVEVTALLTCNFEVDDLRRRQVKLRRRKSLTQMGDVLVAEKYHEVHIVSPQLLTFACSKMSAFPFRLRLGWHNADATASQEKRPSTC
jgi:hypothetical protein